MLLAIAVGVACVVAYGAAAGLDAGASSPPTVPGHPALSGHFPPLEPGTALTQEPRPFRHAQHTDVSCGTCHASEEDPAIVTVRTPGDCASCHHDADRGYTCQACHSPERLRGDRPIEWDMTLTVWDEARTRTLPFDHDRHAGVECGDCHTTPVTLAVTAGCNACHQDHHRDDAQCTTCHVPSQVEAHDYEVHLTCASAGCHLAEAGERPALTRNLCLSCHIEQVDHEPGLSCQQCHMIPEERPLRGMGGISWWPGGGGGR